MEHRVIKTESGAIAYRDTGSPSEEAPVLALHGFASASHQLAPLSGLAPQMRVIMPDYPGCGHSADTPDATFDSLAKAMTDFLSAMGIGGPVWWYCHDYGVPVAMRIAVENPDRISGIIIQNGNMYDEGLTNDLRDLVEADPDDPNTRAMAGQFLTDEALRKHYITGTPQPARVNPDVWTLDRALIRRRTQVNLLCDYHTNVQRYPHWQRYLRDHQPPTLILWGRNDPFFDPAGAHAYRQDLPEATVRVYSAAGHTALQHVGGQIVDEIAKFVGP